MGIRCTPTHYRPLFFATLLQNVPVCSCLLHLCQCGVFFCLAILATHPWPEHKTGSETHNVGPSPPHRDTHGSRCCAASAGMLCSKPQSSRHAHGAVPSSSYHATLVACTIVATSSPIGFTYHRQVASVLRRSHSARAQPFAHHHISPNRLLVFNAPPQVRRLKAGREITWSSWNSGTWAARQVTPHDELFHSATNGRLSHHTAKSLVSTVRPVIPIFRARSLRNFHV